MKKIIINTYTLAELGDEARAKAIEKYRDINTNESDWSEPLTEGFKEKLEGLGYREVKIMFSGFYSQGDGACFTARVDIHAWLRAHKVCKLWGALGSQADCFAFNITHTWRYYYATSTNVEQGFYGESTREAQTQAEAMLKAIEKEREELGNAFYKALRDYSEELESDEMVSDTLEANGYVFLKSGQRFTVAE